MLRTTFKNVTICALLASAATFGILLQPATASAADKSSVKLLESATGKGSPKLFEFLAQQEAVEAQIEALTLQLTQLQTSCDQLGVLAGEADAELASIVGVSEDNLLEIDEAFRIFTEQVAPVLDPETVTLVNDRIQGVRASINSGERVDQGPPIVESVEPVNEKLDELLALLQTLQAASKAVGANGEGKKEYVGHVTLLK